MSYRVYEKTGTIYKVTKVHGTDGREDYLFVILKEGGTATDAIEVAKRTGFLREVRPSLREVRATKAERLDQIVIPEDLESRVIE